MRNSFTVFTDETELSRQSWQFWYGPRGMVLDHWRHETRATKRHKWQADKFAGKAWSRINSRDNRCERPEPPEQVVKVALAGFADSLTYNSEWGR